VSDTRQVLTGILQHTAAALRAARLYPSGHPAVHTPVRHLASALAHVLRERDRIVLGMVDDVLVLDEMPFYDAETRFKAVTTALASRSLESVTFLPGVSLSELETAMGLLSGRDHPDETFGDALKHCELPHLTFRERMDDEDPRARARRTYEESLGTVVDLMSEIRMGRIPSCAGASRVIDEMRDIILTDADALLGLTLLKSYDQYTYNHSVNVAIFSLAFARHLQVGDEALRRVGLAGLLHDVGKVRTAEDIIKKPGALTEEEMKVMQRHPELGVEILEQMQGIDRETEEIVLHHHVRYDGSGYPMLPPGREPHPHGAFVAIADCYDALTTTRPYQKSRHPSEAVRILRRLGGKAYDPEVLGRFVDMVGTYPVGDLVRLSSGELAVVTAANHIDATCPAVRIVSTRDGTPLESPVDVDLAAEPPGSRLVVAPVDPLVKGIDVAKVLGL